MLTFKFKIIILCAIAWHKHTAYTRHTRFESWICILKETKQCRKNTCEKTWNGFFLFRIFLFVAKWSTYFGAITCYLRERKKTKREIFFVERNFNDAKSVAEHATYTHTNVNQSSVCIKMWSERTREFCFFLRTFGIHMCGREGDSLTFAFRFLICRSSLCLKTKPTFCPVSHFWPNSAILMWFRERITREKKNLNSVELIGFEGKRSVFSRVKQIRKRLRALSDWPINHNTATDCSATESLTKRQTIENHSNLSHLVQWSFHRHNYTLLFGHSRYSWVPTTSFPHVELAKRKKEK